MRMLVVRDYRKVSSAFKCLNSALYVELSQGMEMLRLFLITSDNARRRVIFVLFLEFKLTSFSEAVVLFTFALVKNGISWSSETRFKTFMKYFLVLQNNCF